MEQNLITQLDIIRRGAIEIFPEDEFINKLEKTGKNRGQATSFRRLLDCRRLFARLPRKKLVACPRFSCPRFSTSSTANHVHCVPIR